jgi:hypothetical protein
MGLNIRLEPGVRLHIYDVLTSRYYVQRGDTRSVIASGGGLRETLPPGITTTVARIQQENPHWFHQLGLINQTLVSSYALVESFSMLGVEYYDFLDAGNIWQIATGLVNPANIGGQFVVPLPLVPGMGTQFPGGAPGSVPVSAGSNSVGGAPLFLTVPVVAHPVSPFCVCPPPPQPCDPVPCEEEEPIECFAEDSRFVASLYTLTWYAPNDSERNRDAMGVPIWQETSNQPWPTIFNSANPALIGLNLGMTATSGILSWPANAVIVPSEVSFDGWFVFEPLLSTTTRGIPGIFGR